LKASRTLSALSFSSAILLLLEHVSLGGNGSPSRRSPRRRFSMEFPMEFLVEFSMGK